MGRVILVNSSVESKKARNGIVGVNVYEVNAAMANRGGIMGRFDSRSKESNVKRSSWLALLLASTAYAAPCPTGQVRDESALIQLEHTWAAALERHDAEVVGCLLAPEFQDADPDGQLHDRTETLARIPHRRAGSNTLSEMQAHVYGDAGYVRGLNTVNDATGKTLARVRFTDIFVYRDGRWLAVAGHETIVTEQGQKP